MIHHSVRKIKYRSTRSLIDTAALHSYTAVFANIYKTDSVSSADYVKFVQKIKGIHLFSVQTYRNSFFKIDYYVLTFIRGFFRNRCIFKHVLVVRLIFCFFKLKTFVRKMPYIFIAGIRLVFLHRNFQSAVFKEFNFCLAAVHIPFVIAPSGNNLNIRSKSLDCKLKTNLVVSFSSRTVTNCNRFFLTRIFNKYFSDKRTRC